jgi:hypothetical protein
VPTNPTFSAATPKARPRRATCPHCGRPWVDVTDNGVVDKHGPLRRNADGEYVAEGEVCAGTGDEPEYAKRGRPRKEAA